MYRIDVYAQKNKKGNKKVTSHWYETYDEAIQARKAILSFRHKVYTFVPSENREQKSVILGGWTVSMPTPDNKY